MNVVLGLLPLCFIVVIADLLDRMPAIAAAADQRWPMAVGALVLSVGVFAVQQMLTPFRFAIAASVARQVDGYCAARLMSAALSRASLRSLDRQEVLDLLVESRRAFEGQGITPGDAVGGVLSLVYRYTNLAGGIALVGVVLGGYPAVVVGVTAVAIRFVQRGSLGRFAALWGGLARRGRRLYYIRNLCTGPGIGKETRVLGLLDWMLNRHSEETSGFLSRLWKGRRDLLFRPFVWLAVVGLIGATAAFVALAQAIGGGVSLFQLTVALQSILIPLRFGVYFPESDTNTQYGMRSFAALRKFEEIAADPAETPPGLAGPYLPAAGTSIRFEDVVFRYEPGGPAVLDHLDLEIEAGKSTAIVGLNGAGKTTLVKLLTRLHDPESGRVTADGADLREVDPRAWQRGCAVIFQDYVRYELSMDANIRMGAPWATDSEAALERVIDKAGLREVLTTLPHGRDTVLSRQYDNGHELSGGQWQRTALARAFYAVEHGAKLLVLDEPTAQLDVRAEARFFAEFLTLTSGLTSVVISHRFSAVRHADRIVVLEHGKVLESGTHDELVAAEGRYAELFRLQAHHFEDVLDGAPAEVG